jgi:hypothetical protein
VNWVGLYSVHGILTRSLSRKILMTWCAKYTYYNIWNRKQFAKKLTDRRISNLREETEEFTFWTFKSIFQLLIPTLLFELLSQYSNC